MVPMEFVHKRAVGCVAGLKSALKGSSWLGRELHVPGPIEGSPNSRLIALHISKDLACACQGFKHAGDLIC